MTSKHHEKTPPKTQQMCKMRTVFIITAVIAVTLLLVYTNKKSGNVEMPASDTVAGQEIRMAVEGASFNPSHFTVTQGPVRWVIDGSKSVGCTQYIISKDLGISKKLEKGENVIIFTPPHTGDFRFTCGMGMVEGTISVI